MISSKKNPWIKKLKKWIKGSLALFSEESSSRPKQKKVRRLSKKKTAAKRKLVRIASTKKRRPAKPARPAKKKQPKKRKGKQALTRFVSKSAQSIKKQIKPGVAKKVLPGLCVGKVSHYFPKANACAFRVEKAELKQGAKIHIVGAATNLKMTIGSIQINRIPVPSGRPGEDVGIGVNRPVAVGDLIYLI